MVILMGIFEPPQKKMPLAQNEGCGLCVSGQSTMQRSVCDGFCLSFLHEVCVYMNASLEFHRGICHLLKLLLKLRPRFFQRRILIEDSMKSKAAGLGSVERYLAMILFLI